MPRFSATHKHDVWRKPGLRPTTSVATVHERFSVLNLCRPADRYPLYLSLILSLSLYLSLSALFLFISLFFILYTLGFTLSPPLFPPHPHISTLHPHFPYPPSCYAVLCKAMSCSSSVPGLPTISCAYPWGKTYQTTLHQAMLANGNV